MNPSYSWQPLGALLVAKGLLTENQLQWALSEQRRTGRLVGEILVESGTISAFTLGRALGESARRRDPAATQAGRRKRLAAHQAAVWRPLGKLLIEEGFLTRAQLEHALDEQRASDGRRLLGEILVAEGVLSGVSLARALAEQQGLELESGEDVETIVLNTVGPSRPSTRYGRSSTSLATRRSR